MGLAIYGAYGYTGRLVTQLAVERGHAPLLLGRDEAQLAALATEHSLVHRAVGLDQAHVLREVLEPLDLVVHCAGPFSRTASQMVEACLDSGTHYVDVTGEIDVLESVLDRHDRALKSAISLLPGSGFDVVPTDCLAALVATELPAADSLEIAFRAGGGLSRGTAVTSIEGMRNGGKARVDGRITSVPPGWRRRSFDFPSGAQTATSIPWGDVATATRSTGISNVVTYTPVPLASLQPVLGAAMRIPGVQAGMTALTRRLVGGPDDSKRARSRCEIVVEATAGDKVVEAAMVTPNGYSLTADSVLRIVERVLDGAVPAGALTPSQAHGADFVLGLDGVELVRPPALRHRDPGRP